MIALFSRKRETWHALAYLTLPFLVYLIPLALGYRWNALDPRTPRVTGMQSYQGRLPDNTISIEHYGTGVDIVPFYARMRQYLENGDLPLWNPYSGLGEPFAAQGEGCPYSPLAIVRALVTYANANWVTILIYYLSSFFLYCFARNLEISQPAAILAGALWGISGALALHIARDNYADQLALIPVMFWGCQKAVHQRTVSWYALFALLMAVYLLAGHIQIALTPLLLILPFAFICARARGADSPLRVTTAVAIAILLGAGISSFALLPHIEAMRVLANKNVEGLGFCQVPFANGLAFIFPLCFGLYFQSWLPGTSANVVAWDNLYQYAGLSLVILILIGWKLHRSFMRDQKIFFLFFAFVAVFLFLRFLGSPLILGVNWVPIVGRQSPKHANGTIVFCLIVAASITIDHLRAGSLRSVRWLVLGGIGIFSSSVATMIALQRHGGRLNVHAAILCASLLALMLVVILGAFWLVRRRSSLFPSPAGGVILMGYTAIGELFLYVPLGNSSHFLLGCRVGLFLLLTAAGLLLATGWRRPSHAVTVLGLLIYALLIILPAKGLPRAINLDLPTPCMTWLRERVGADYRVFGITSGYSSLGKLQDISAHGPFAPPSYYNFIDLIAHPSQASFTRDGSSFWLVNPATLYSGFPDFSFDRYFEKQPILDWLGVRYLVLDHRLFRHANRQDYLEVIGQHRLPAVYTDKEVTIVESATAQSRAYYISSPTIRPDQQTILHELGVNPSWIQAKAMLEAHSLTAEERRLVLSNSEGLRLPATITESRPNRVALRINTPTSGLVVLKDSYCPGWSATRNGKPVPILRVNGFVRGILIPQAGNYEVIFTYCPKTFITGLIVSLCCSGFVLAILMISAFGNPAPFSAATCILAVGLAMIVTYQCLVTYTGFSLKAFFR